MSDEKKPAAGDLSQHVIPADVPVFNCLVYVGPSPAGGVRARVANLAGLQVDATSERQALTRIVPAFKQRVSEFLQAQAAIPWIEPPPEPAAGEATRFIPVHL
ncbi:MAG: hypothetical protein VB877_20780 [Pirellulaceae bacterium]